MASLEAGRIAQKCAWVHKGAPGAVLTAWSSAADEPAVQSSTGSRGLALHKNLAMEIGRTCGSMHVHHSSSSSSSDDDSPPSCANMLPPKKIFFGALDSASPAPILRFSPSLTASET